MTKNRKKKKSKLPSKGSYRPRSAVETQFIRVLDGWHSVTVEDPFDKERLASMECIISPDNKTYRRAHSWEAPVLVIDASILPPEHHIRLVRVTNIQLRKMAKRLLRKRLRQHGKE